MRGPGCPTRIAVVALLGYGGLLGALGCAHSPATTPATAASQPEPAGGDLAHDGGAAESPARWQTVTIQHPEGTALQAGPAWQPAVAREPPPAPVRRGVPGLPPGMQAPMPTTGGPK